jgi:hypothetical protein
MPTGRSWPARTSPPRPVRGQVRSRTKQRQPGPGTSCRIHERRKAQCPPTPAGTAPGAADAAAGRRRAARRARHHHSGLRGSGHPRRPPRWVGAWNASPQPPNPVLDGISTRGLADQALRLIARTHAGGSWLRLCLANTCGQPVHPRPTGPATWHWDARETDYVSTAGDHTRDAEAAAFATPVTSWFCLDGLDIRGSTTRGAVVTLGEVDHRRRQLHHRRQPSLDRLPGPAAAAT